MRCSRRTEFSRHWQREGNVEHQGWTQEREELLVRMWMDGYSGSQIANELGGTTRNAVVGKAYRLNLASNGHPKTDPKHYEARRRLSHTEIEQRITARRKRDRERKRVYRERLVMPELPETCEHATQLIDLRDFERQCGRKLCRWPIGNPSATMAVCGAITEHDECVYCATHARMAYVPWRPMTEGTRKFLLRKASPKGTHLGLTYDRVLEQIAAGG